MTMQIEKITSKNTIIAHVTGSEILISDFQSAIDMIMSVKYDAETKNIAISKDLYYR